MLALWTTELHEKQAPRWVWRAVLAATGAVIAVTLAALADRWRGDRSTMLAFFKRTLTSHSRVM
jgi:hypothetical protein